MKSLVHIFLLFSFSVVMSCNVKPAEIPAHAGNAMVVLGFPATAEGKPTPIMKYRLDLALDLYQKSQFSTILVTGGAVQNSHPEAEVMKEYLVKNGIQSHKIITDTKATNTFENAINSRKILRNKGFTNPTVVTSPEHRDRARRFFSIFFREFSMAE